MTHSQLRIPSSIVDRLVEHLTAETRAIGAELVNRLQTVSEAEDPDARAQELGHALGRYAAYRAVARELESILLSTDLTGS